VSISNKGRVPVSLNKSMNKGNQPYRVGDFDALFVFLRCRKYYFFIPAVELENRGALASSTSVGLQTIHIYTHDYTYRTGIRPDLWSQEFCYKSDDTESFRRALNYFKAQ